MGTQHQVAATLAQQIGRPAFVMIGARDILGREDGLSFRVGRNAKSVTHLRITLDPSDTYTVEALRIRRVQGVLTPKVVETRELVYADSLHQTIEALTGLYTKL
jgi:hypothetical protein